MLANDRAIDPGEPLTAVIETRASVGSESLEADGSLTFQAPATFEGEVVFSYRASDGLSSSNVALVSISVRRGTVTDSPPVPRDDSYTVERDSTLRVSALEGILRNDSLGAGPGPLVATLASGPAHGTLGLGSTGELSYSPDLGYVGGDLFTYILHDGLSASAWDGAVVLTITESGITIPDLAFTSIPKTHACLGQHYYYLPEIHDSTQGTLTYSLLEGPGLAPQEPTDCRHSECLTGAPLTSTCSECADTVCSQLPECCTSVWDSYCVWAENTSCGDPGRCFDPSEAFPGPAPALHPDIAYGLGEGLVSWSASTLGLHTFRLEVQAESGRTAEQLFQVEVEDCPLEPGVPDCPSPSALPPGKPWSFDIDALFPYAFGEEWWGYFFFAFGGPSGLHLRNHDDQLPRLEWTPTAEQLGPHSVSVGGYFGSFEYQFGACPLEVSPTALELCSFVSEVQAGQTFQCVLSIPERGHGPVSYELIAAPPGAEVDPLAGIVTLPAVSQRDQSVTVSVSDAAGELGWKYLFFHVSGDFAPGAPRVPIFLTTPRTRACAGQNYAYRPTVVDKRGEALTYSLTEAPLPPQPPTACKHPECLTGAALEPSCSPCAGAVCDLSPECCTTTWDSSCSALVESACGDRSCGTPPVLRHPSEGYLVWNAEPGTHTITLEAENVSGLVARQSYELVVSECELLPPLITTNPAPLTLPPLSPWRYDLEARFPYSALDVSTSVLGPPGMVVSPSTGGISWVPAESQAGSHAVYVELQGDFPGWGYDVLTQSFTLTVDPDAPPQCPAFAERAAGDRLTCVIHEDGRGEGAVRYELSGPSVGLSIDSLTGVLDGFLTCEDPDQEHLPLVRSIEVSIADDSGVFGSRRIEVTVEPPAVAPLFTSTPPIRVLSGLFYRYHATVVDPDLLGLEPVTIALLEGPPGMAFSNPAMGLLDWDTAGVPPGTYSVTLRATDASGLSTDQSWTIEVLSEDEPPYFVLAPVRDGEVLELGVSYEFPLIARDPGALGTLQFELVEAPAGASIVTDRFDLILACASYPFLSCAVLTYTPADLGEQTFRVRATDDAGLSSELTFVVLVVSPGDPPSFVSTPVTSGAVGVPYVYDAEAVSPVAGEVLTYRLVNAPSGMAIEPSTGVITMTPVAAQAGAHFHVVISAVDTQGRGTTQTYDLVIAPNAPPLFTTVAPLAVATAGQLYVQVLEATDPEGDDFSFSIVEGPAGMSIDPPSGRLEWTPAVDQLGLHLVAVSVADESGSQSWLSFTLSVSRDGQSPFFASAPITSVSPGDSYQYDAEAVDPDGGSVSYTLAEGPSAMSLDASGLLTWVPSTADVGSHLVRLQATDPAGNVGTQTFVLTVGGAPAITTDPVLFAAAGVEYVYDVDAEDPLDSSGSPLSFGLVTSPEGMRIDEISGLITWIPLSTDLGVHDIQVVAFGTLGRYALQSYRLTVGTSGLAPVIESSPGLVAAVGQPYAYDVEATDPDGGSILYSLDFGPEGMVIDPITGLVSWDAPVIGEALVIVRATDGGGSFARQSFTLRTPSALRITSSPVLVAAVNRLYEYDVDAEGPSGGPFVFELAEAPEGMTVEAGTGVISWVPSISGNSGVRVVVSSADGVAEQSYALAVQHAPVITSAPPASRVLALMDYRHQVTALDGDGDSVVFSVGAPPGVSIHPFTGELSYRFRTDQLGAQTVRVRVTDPSGLFDEQELEFEVSLPDREAYEAEVLELVNQLRAAGTTCGGVPQPPVPPLTFDARLHAAARAHSEDMAARDYFAHVSPDGVTPADRVRAAGYLGSFRAENLQAATQSPAQAVSGWQSSPGHCRNLMSPLPNELGVGYAGVENSTYVHYWTQIFGIGDGDPNVDVPPIFASAPLMFAVPGLPYRTDVRVLDNAGDVQTFALEQAPSGMFFHEGRRELVWAVPADAEGEFAVSLRVTDRAGGSDLLAYTLTVEAPPVVPDPRTVAPPLDAHRLTSFVDQVSFLYQGSRPLQQGVQGPIEARRAAVIRGQVTNLEGVALAGVRISIAGHSELGVTFTRADGMFDLVANGGGVLTVRYELAGYLLAERPVKTPWQDYVFAPDVALVAYDPRVSTVSLGSTEWQLAESSVVTDQDGPRGVTVAFPPGARAELELPDGSRTPLAEVSVRATEYTVGPNGPRAMPAPLPPTSEYTYAVELSFDEAVAAGAESVKLDRDVPVYVDNFLGFAPGTVVPVGSYVRGARLWVPERNGLVVGVLSTSGGLAALDLGAGSPADLAALSSEGIEATELGLIAARFAAGSSFTRFRVHHLSAYDCNFGRRCTSPSCPPVEVPDPTNEECLGCTDEVPGSILESENQTVGERIGIVGTPLTLNYRSSRVPGRRSQYTIDVAATGATVPSGLIAAKVRTVIAGVRTDVVAPASPSEVTSLEWSGEDAYGRRVLGQRTATVLVGHLYPSGYGEAATGTVSFAIPPTAALPVVTRALTSSGDAEYSLRQTQLTHVGTWDARSVGLGGWTLDVHHFYDVASGTLYLGSGGERSGNTPLLRGRVEVLANVEAPTGLALAPNGDLYIAAGDKIWRRTAVGTMVWVAGTGAAGFSGDGGLAVAAELNGPNTLVLDEAGNLFVSDSGNRRIRMIDRDGFIRTIAGNGEEGFGSELESSRDMKSRGITGMTIDARRDLYFADNGNNRIRRLIYSTVDPYAMVQTVLGAAALAATYPGPDGVSWPSARVTQPLGLAFAPNGDLYFVAHEIRLRNVPSAIYRFSTDGLVSLFSGLNIAAITTAERGDGEHRLQAWIDNALWLHVDDAGIVYFSEVVDGTFGVVRRIAADGTISRFVGNEDTSLTVPGGPPTATGLPIGRGMAVAPDGSFYVADTQQGRVLKIAPVLPGFEAGLVSVVSADGSEVYRFDERGAHIDTRDAGTGVTLWSFGYDSQGRLSFVRDLDGLETRIVRNGSGEPTAIVGPHGAATSVRVGAGGWLEEVSNPQNEATKLEYVDAGGLLSRLETPRGPASRYEYDGRGWLTRAQDAAGGSQTFTRTSAPGQGDVVTRGTALGRTTRYSAAPTPVGGQVRESESPSGQKAKSEQRADGTSVMSSPDGTVSESTVAPDPRFGMLSPFVSRSAVRLPSGLESVMTATRAVSGLNPEDPLDFETETSRATINGRTFTTEYSRAAQTIVTRSPLGRTTATLLDANGRISESRVPGILPISYGYDALGRVESVTQGTRETRYTYDSLGRLATVRDPLGRTTAMSYDLADRLLVQLRPDGETTTFSYDLNGNLSTLTPPGRPAHAFEYTPIDQEAKYLPPDLGFAPRETETFYTADREVDSVGLPDGRVIDFEYDDAGRLDLLNMSAGTYDYSYDAVDRLQSISAPGGENLSYDYDGPLVTQVTWSGAVSGSVQTAYDSDFRVTTQKVNNDYPVTYHYDQDGLLDHYTIAGAGGANPATMFIERDPANGLVTGTTVGVVTDSRQYNEHGEIRHYTARANGTVVFEVDYVRDQLGRIDFKTETVQGVTKAFDYEYDVVGRLTDVWEDAVLVEHFEYDPNGNRTLGMVRGVTSMGTYDDQDRLLSYGQFAYTYSANGDLETKTDTVTSEATAYSYDEFGNLREVWLPNGDHIEYVIDGQNRRVGKKVNGAFVQGFAYGGQLDPVAELDESRGVVSRFGYGLIGHSPDVIEKDGQKYRVIMDYLGTPRLIIDQTIGSVVEQLALNAWGDVLEDSAPGWQPFGFGGGIDDRDVGLVRFGVREYDALIGRWTSKEPLRFVGGRNFYAYSLGDAINFVDRDGLLVEVVFLIDRVDRETGRAYGTLTVTDLDTLESATIGAYSGGPFGVDKFNPGIPVGTYDILEFHLPADPMNRFRLDRVDLHRRNDRDDTAGRGEYRLHGPGGTTGCINAGMNPEDNRAWNERVRKLIFNTKTDSVLENLTMNPFDTLKFYGTLRVRLATD